MLIIIILTVCLECSVKMAALDRVWTWIIIPLKEIKSKKF